MKKIPIIGTLLAALVASLCCLGPALLVALGFGGLSVTAFLAKSHWLLYGVSFVILGATFFLLRKQKLKLTCCETNTCAPKSFLKTISGIFILAGLFFGLQYGLTHKVASWLYQRQEYSSKTLTEPSNIKTNVALVSISGMTCSACASGIEAVLKETPGVVDAKVSFDQKKALICFNPNQLSEQSLEQQIAKTGYSGKIVSEAACTKPGLSSKL